MHQNMGPILMLISDYPIRSQSGSLRGYVYMTTKSSFGANWSANCFHSIYTINLILIQKRRLTNFSLNFAKVQVLFILIMKN